MIKRILAAVIATVMILCSFTAFAQDAPSNWVYTGNGTHAILNEDGSVAQSGTCDVSATLVPATCLYDGFWVHTCSVCLHSYKSDYVKAVGHHEFTGWVGNRDFTFTEDGTESRVCKACGEKETRTQADSALYKQILGVKDFDFNFFVNAIKILGNALITRVKILIGFFK